MLPHQQACPSLMSHMLTLKIQSNLFIIYLKKKSEKHHHINQLLQISITPGGAEVKSVCLQCGRPVFNPWVGNIPWRRKWQPTPVLLLGKSHGRKSLVGYSPWVTKSWTWLSEFTSLNRKHRKLSIFNFLLHMKDLLYLLLIEMASSMTPV